MKGAKRLAILMLAAGAAVGLALGCVGGMVIMVWFNEAVDAQRTPPPTTEAALQEAAVDQAMRDALLEQAQAGEVEQPGADSIGTQLRSLSCQEQWWLACRSQFTQRECTEAMTHALRRGDRIYEGMDCE